MKEVYIVAGKFTIWIAFPLLSIYGAIYLIVNYWGDFLHWYHRTFIYQTYRNLKFRYEVHKGFEPPADGLQRMWDSLHGRNSKHYYRKYYIKYTLFWSKKLNITLISSPDKTI